MQNYSILTRNEGSRSGPGRSLTRHRRPSRAVADGLPRGSGRGGAGPPFYRGPGIALPALPARRSQATRRRFYSFSCRRAGAVLGSRGDRTERAATESCADVLATEGGHGLARRCARPAGRQLAALPGPALPSALGPRPSAGPWSGRPLLPRCRRPTQRTVRPSQFPPHCITGDEGKARHCSPKQLAENGGKKS